MPDWLRTIGEWAYRLDHTGGWACAVVRALGGAVSDGTC